MKFYRTEKDNLINLEEVAMIYKGGPDEPYTVALKNGKEYSVPELGIEDVDHIMDYNAYFIK